jgi:transposase
MPSVQEPPWSSSFTGQKRADLRLVGLGLVVTRDGGIPLLSHTYSGNKPDVTQFPLMLSELCGRYTAYTTAASVPGQVTVVFDAGQNSAANFADLLATDIGYVTSLPPSDHTDLLALPKRSRRRLDQTRFPGLTALQRRKDIYGRNTRVILTHSPTLHAGQSRGLDQTLAKAQARLGELAQRLARGKTRRDKDAVTAEIHTICKETWVKRILTWNLTGTTPTEFHLTWSIDTDARNRLEEEIFGKQVLVTNHDDWPIADIVAAYRSQSDAQFGFRQLKDPHAVSFSPMNHFIDQAIRVHTYTCVLALQLAHLMRCQADQAGLHLSVRALVDALAGIGETVLIYPSSGGRPQARRMLTETTTDHNNLINIFDLHQWTPRT